jgi:hypothetical protein
MTLLKPGSNARDKITGFEGVITALHQELGEPNQLRCQFRLEAPSCDGKPGETQWFDVSRIEAARKDADEAPAIAPATGDEAPTETPKAEDGRLPIKAIIAMLMSMGIAKTIRIEGCNKPDCPVCTAARKEKKFH